MKSYWFLAPLAVHAAAIPGDAQVESDKHLQSRQLTGPTITPFKIDNVESTYKKEGVKRAKVWYGPFAIPSIDKVVPNPKAMDPQGTTWQNMLAGFPSDITLLETNTYLVYQNGSAAGISSGVYNHHVTMGDVSKPLVLIASCPGKPPQSSLKFQVFAGVGEDKGRYIYTDQSSDSFSGGYYIGNNDKIFFTSEIVNYSKEDKQLFALIDIEYTTGKVSNGFEVTSETLSVNQCEGESKGIRPKGDQKKFSVVSKPMTLNVDGYIMNQRGHLHDGGVNQVLLINGKVVCNSVAKYGGADATMVKPAGGHSHGGGAVSTPDNAQVWETLSSMSECHAPFKVSKGDVLSLESHYDLEKYPAREHAMGGGMAEEMGLMLFSLAQKRINN